MQNFLFSLDFFGRKFNDFEERETIAPEFEMFW
jgi:hypothetical protein